MTRVLVLSAFTLSLAGMGLAQQTGYESSMQQPYSTYGEYSQYGYNPYAEQWGPSAWQSEEYGQTTPYWGEQGTYPAWTGAYHPYGFVGYGNYLNWSQPTPMTSPTARFAPERENVYPYQYTWTGAPETFAPQRQMFRPVTPWLGQRMRVVGSIQQHIPAHQFSTELNPNDVLVNVRTPLGRERLVDLGPGAEAANFPPNLGARMVASGIITYVNGQPLLIAHRAREVTPGMFQEAAFGERGFRFRQPTWGRTSSWQGTERSSW